MDSQQHGIQEGTTCRVDSICGCNVGDEGDDDDTANTIRRGIIMDNTEIESIGTVSGVIRATSEQN